MSLPSLALPGQPLGPISKYAPGPGTHIFDSQIYASILGPVTSTPPSKRPATSSTLLAPSSNTLTNPSNLPTLSIVRHASSAASGGNWAAGGAGTSVLPEVDAAVLAKVTRLGARQATVEILIVGDNVCREGFQGLVRREDVRATEKDRVKIPESFRVGDVVRGVVVSGTTLVYVRSELESRKIFRLWLLLGLHKLILVLSRYRLVISRVTISLQRQMS